MAKGTEQEGRRAGRSASRPPWLWIAGAGVIVILALLLWLPGRMAQSGLPVEGERIADFTLPDSEGTPFHLAEAYRDNVLILVFYRGYG